MSTTTSGYRRRRSHTTAPNDCLRNWHPRAQPQWSVLHHHHSSKLHHMEKTEAGLRNNDWITILLIGLHKILLWFPMAWRSGSRHPDHAPFKCDSSHMLGLGVTYWCTEFDHSSFSRSRDMVGAHQNLTGSRALTTPRSGMICHSRARTCYYELVYTIWSLSPPHYAYMKRGRKFCKWGDLGYVGATQIAPFDRA